MEDHMSGDLYAQRKGDSRKGQKKSHRYNALIHGSDNHSLMVSCEVRRYGETSRDVSLPPHVHHKERAFATGVEHSVDKAGRWELADALLRDGSHHVVVDVIGDRCHQPERRGQRAAAAADQGQYVVKQGRKGRVVRQRRPKGKRGIVAHGGPRPADEREAWVHPTARMAPELRSVVAQRKEERRRCRNGRRHSADEGMEAERAPAWLFLEPASQIPYRHTASMYKYGRPSRRTRKTKMLRDALHH